MTTPNIPLVNINNDGTGTIADGKPSFKDYSLNI